MSGFWAAFSAPEKAAFGLVVVVWTGVILVSLAEDLGVGTGASHPVRVVVFGCSGLFALIVWSAGDRDAPPRRVLLVAAIFPLVAAVGSLSLIFDATWSTWLVYGAIAALAVLAFRFSPFRARRRGGGTK